MTLAATTDARGTLIAFVPGESNDTLTAPRLTFTSRDDERLFDRAMVEAGYMPLPAYIDKWGCGEG